MVKQEVSFNKDIEELFSVKNFVIGIIVPVVLGVIFMEGNLILNILIILGIVFGLIIVYFILKWVFIYRKNKKSKRKYPFGGFSAPEKRNEYINELIN